MSDTGTSSEFPAVLVEELDTEDVQDFYRKLDKPAPEIDELAETRLPSSLVPKEPTFSDLCAYLRRKDHEKAEKNFEEALKEAKLFCCGGKQKATSISETIPPPNRRRRNRSK